MEYDEMNVKAKRSVVRGMCHLAPAVLFYVLAIPTLQAGVAEIQFTGMDIEYDGVTGFDITTASTDPLGAVTFYVDGVQTGTALTSGISADVSIPGVTGIGIGGGTVTSSTGGTLDLVLDGGSLSLELSEVGITYSNISESFKMVLAATTASIIGQDLPFGIFLDDPVTVSFLTHIDTGSLTDDGTMVTGFTASGTGQVQGGGDSGVIKTPEPTSIVLALIALVGITFSSCFSKYAL
jgi:hypothetical protein